MKGQLNEEAVLCTADKTYSLRLAESSNSCLLGSEAQPEQRGCTKYCCMTDNKLSTVIKLQAFASAHLEIMRRTPRTGLLRTLLAICPYAGRGREQVAPSSPTKTGRRLTLEDLEDLVQASTAELRAALRDARAFCVDGGWCLLDTQLELDTMECVLALYVERGWSLAALPTADCVTACLEQGTDGFDDLVVRHCLRTHSTLAAAAWDEWVAAFDAPTHSIDSAAVCQFRARVMLTDCDVWPKERFLEAWEESLPPGIVLDARQLDGLAVSLAPSDSLSVGEEFVQSLPLNSLPLAPKERLAALFKVKRAWVIHELAPYLGDILEPGKTAEALVLQHARSVAATDGSVKYVSRKS